MGAKRGRPPIGPKVQASVPHEVAAYIRKRQEELGERDQSVITRELVIAGYQMLTGEA